MYLLVAPRGQFFNPDVTSNQAQLQQDNSRVNLGHMSLTKSGRAGRDGEDVDMGMEESRFQQTGLGTAGKGRAPS